MKTLKMCLLVMLAVFSLTIIPVGVNAADIASATIVRMGIYPGVGGSSGVVVWLKDNATTPQWAGSRQFYLSQELGNQGLATLLTAFSMDRTVLVRIGGSVAAVPVAASLINIIYINQ